MVPFRLLTIVPFVGLETDNMVRDWPSGSPSFASTDIAIEVPSGVRTESSLATGGRFAGVAAICNDSIRSSIRPIRSVLVVASPMKLSIFDFTSSNFTMASSSLVWLMSASTKDRSSNSSCL